MHLVVTAVSAKRAFLIGWLFGLAHFTIGLNWLAKSFTFQSNMPALLGWLAVPLVAAGVANFSALATCGAWWIRRFSGKTGMSLPFVLAFSGCWIVAEWLRSWVFTGFPWNPLGVIALSEFAAPAIFIGSYGLSGAVLIGVGVLLLALKGQWRNAALLAVSIALFWTVSLVTLVGESVTAAINSKVAGKRRTNITVVQPNIGQEERNRFDYDAISFDRLAKYSRPRTYLEIRQSMPKLRPEPKDSAIDTAARDAVIAAATATAADDAPRLIFWPESATPWKLESGYPYRYYQFQPGGIGARRARCTGATAEPSRLADYRQRPAGI